MEVILTSGFCKLVLQPLLQLQCICKPRLTSTKDTHTHLAVPANTPGAPFITVCKFEGLFALLLAEEKAKCSQQRRARHTQELSAKSWESGKWPLLLGFYLVLGNPHQKGNFSLVEPRFPRFLTAPKGIPSVGPALAHAALNTLSERIPHLAHTGIYRWKMGEVKVTKYFG